ncbi:plasmid stabilization protein [Bosea sp. AAP35]|uniref:type II toxin-antitoxin system RelE/ParE family toxin n=1 Tax=Bosea sp. AAP35 TaxID=1523417 RepID=UPI0006B99C5E|nr:type II toxin-antitoxin system RelE/ParE family toxin [Bosea sp. AAP35]KPF72691.1 plasmid stabilization protein [Bosea sp. AAP35]
MSRRVEWSSSAIDDFDLAIAHIAQDNPAAARKVALGIGRSASALGTHSTGRPGRIPGSYEKSVTGLPYVIAYAVPDDTRIVVLRVIHTSRDWPRGGWPQA